MFWRYPQLVLGVPVFVVGQNVLRYKLIMTVSVFKIDLVM